MIRKKLISPQVYTFETDKTEKFYPAILGSGISGGGVPPTFTSSGSNGGSTDNNNNNNNNEFILLEDGFYMLQEDGSKIYL